MSSTEIAAMIVFLIVLSAAGMLLIRSTDNALRLMDRVYNRPRQPRPARETGDGA